MTHDADNAPQRLNNPVNAPMIAPAKTYQSLIYQIQPAANITRETQDLLVAIRYLIFRRKGPVSRGQSGYSFVQTHIWISEVVRKHQPVCYLRCILLS